MANTVLFFDFHQEGCTPSEPCNNCKAVRLLERKLDEGEIDELRHYLENEPAEECLVENYAASKRLAEIPNFCRLDAEVRRALAHSDIVTLEDLCVLTQNDLLRLPGIGRGRLRDIVQFLQADCAGYRLGMDFPDKSAEDAT